MKILAVIFNIVLVAFTCLVLATDGLPREAGYIILAILLVLIPILSLVLLFRSSGRPGLGREQKIGGEEGEGEDRSSTWTMMKTAAILGNIVMFGFSVWAIVSQSPHPEEEGFMAYVVVVLVTPILNLLAVTRAGSGLSWLHAGRKNSM